MKLFIPNLSSFLRLTKDWEFNIVTEYRNFDFVEAGKFEEKGLLPAETVLSVERIYIRKNASDFDSITFRVDSCPVKNLEKKRFFVKLEDANNIEFSLDITSETLSKRLQNKLNKQKKIQKDLQNQLIVLKDKFPKLFEENFEIFANSIVENYESLVKELNKAKLIDSYYEKYESKFDIENDTNSPEKCYTLTKEKISQFIYWSVSESEFKHVTQMYNDFKTNREHLKQNAIEDFQKKIKEIEESEVISSKYYNTYSANNKRLLISIKLYPEKQKKNVYSNCSTLCEPYFSFDGGRNLGCCFSIHGILGNQFKNCGYFDQFKEYLLQEYFEKSGNEPEPELKQILEKDRNYYVSWKNSGRNQYKFVLKD